MILNSGKKDINLNKIFILFLILHLLIWSTIALTRKILPIDALECIYWGGLIDLGTNKHPPLAGWLANFVYNSFWKTDISIYILGQCSIVIGFIYLFKLGKIFLSETESFLAVMLLEACFAYTYMGIYDGFNPNFLLLCFLPIISYYFYKSVNEENLWNWVKLGIFTGLSFLAKYQTLMLFIPLFTFLIITPIGRKQFKNKGFYLSAIIAFLIVLPHIIWLFNNDFFSFNYFLVCEQRYATFYHGPLKYLYSPFMFLLNQVYAIIGVVFIYFTTLLFSKEKIIKNKNTSFSDKAFLICAGVVPIFLQSLNGLSGNYMIPQWGYSLLFMSSILLFYFFPFKLSDKAIKYMIFWVFAAMIITLIVLGSIFSTEKNFANRFDVEQITNTLNNIYESKTGVPMKYIGGFIELSIPLSIYNNGKYITVLNTYNHPNIWINQEDMKKCGVMILGRNAKLMPEYISLTVPQLVNKPKIQPFKFTVKNCFGKKRTYMMFYAIVPPNAN